ncbi:WecB/TagA/CpsF family glycosyltransferase [Streptosporangium sp. H16]|uniref:WecB/TagA/CpsF family glycosyltransferase n=1 Tax=Streptosporangium sp. H16 TaxID=3444184 RepID=UPI003F79BA9B
MAPITEQPRVTLRHGAWIVPSMTEQAAERPPAPARHGPPVASLLTGQAVERPPVFPRHGLVLAPSAAGQAVERPRATARYGLPVLPPAPGRAAGPPPAVTRRDSPVMSSVVRRAEVPATRDTVTPTPPLTDHRSATTGRDPVPGLPAVAGRAGTPVARRGTTPGVPRLRPRLDKATRRRLRRRVHVAGVAIDPMTESEVVDHVIAALKRGEGGHLVTPNVDISRTVARDPRARRFVERADLAVADGMPLVWAARLLGTPIPGRVTGADLIWSLSEAAAFYRHPVYLLGGPRGTAAQAARELVNRHPTLMIAGVDAPPYGFEDDPESYARVRDAVIAAAPRLVFVGLGFPRQERLIASLRRDLPGTWFVGCGSAISFAAGTVRRAPAWMRRGGLEWIFRLTREPGRLARRYLVDDLPYALRLLTVSLVRGLFS